MLSHATTILRNDSESHILRNAEMAGEFTNTLSKNRRRLLIVLLLENFYSHIVDCGIIKNDDSTVRTRLSMCRP